MRHSPYRLVISRIPHLIVYNTSSYENFNRDFIMKKEERVNKRLVLLYSTEVRPKRKVSSTSKTRVLKRTLQARQLVQNRNKLKQEPLLNNKTVSVVSSVQEAVKTIESSMNRFDEIAKKFLVSFKIKKSIVFFCIWILNFERLMSNSLPTGSKSICRDLEESCRWRTFDTNRRRFPQTSCKSYMVLQKIKRLDTRLFNFTRL